MIRLIISVVLISLIFPGQAAVSSCWYPDGKTMESGHVPCNQTALAASACCDPLDSCSTSGFCLGRTGWAYRGSCTDQTWASPNCARQQPSCMNNPVTDAPFRFWSALLSCGQPGLKETEYCCGFDENVSCCNSSFTLGSTGSAFKPGNDAFVASVTSGNITTTVTVTSAAVATTTIATTTTSVTNAGSYASEGNAGLGTTIALGVGLPLTTLALGIIGFLFWRDRRKGSLKETDVPPRSVENISGGGRITEKVDENQHYDEMAVQKVSHQTQISPFPAQLHNEPMYEAPVYTDPHELHSFSQLQ